ncbi:MAG: 7-cyano-7-deazaguanine synthase QueC [Opitutales bacterium]|nr:7-cyano-7-deazaguanine synthase QueC [Opitutales bacterium]
MKSIIVYSGGMDSTVLLYQLVAAGDEVKALTIHYGQRHEKEINCARALAKGLGVEHRVVDLSSLAELLGGSALTSLEVEVPEGHYAEENMKATVVPNRNMILLAVAAGWAISSQFDRVGYAAHAGDHAVYPDCRPEFADALDAAIQLADWREVRLDRPFLDLTKAEIVKLGVDLGVPFDRTWSCYQGGELHCGRCGTCVERREAFHLAGIPDPTPYASGVPTVEEMIANDWKL